MTQSLSAAEVQFYRREGYLTPVAALTHEQAVEYRRHLENSERTFGPLRPGQKGTRSYLLFRWADALVREAPVLDVIEDLIGPDILVTNLTIFAKAPRSPGYVSWHQDSTYLNLRPDDEQVTAWVALSEAPVEAGCMEVVPGSHLLGQLPHVETAAADNLLSRGQQLKVPADLSRRAFMPLRTGQMSLHHTYMLHRSGPNTTADRRIGLTVTYVPTHCRLTSNARVSATLVRGVDRCGHFELQSPPKSDCDADSQAAHAEAMRSHAEMRSLLRSGTGGPIPLP